MTLTTTMVETCLSRLPARIGPDTLAIARRCLIDSLACGYAAADERPVRVLRESLRAVGSGGESSVIGHPDRARADDAALINGTMISLQLFDDSHVQMRGHPSGPLLPAVLAVGEAKDRTLAQALTALASRRAGDRRHPGLRVFRRGNRARIV